MGNVSLIDWIRTFCEPEIVAHFSIQRDAGFHWRSGLVLGPFYFVRIQLNWRFEKVVIGREFAQAKLNH